MGRLIGLVSLLLIVPALCFGQISIPQVCTSSGSKTADAAIKATGGKLCGVLIITDGTTDAKVTIYDDPDSADGTVLFQMTVTGSDDRGGGFYPFIVNAPNGIYADEDNVSKEPESYIVYYQ